MKLQGNNESTEVYEEGICRKRRVIYEKEDNYE